VLVYIRHDSYGLGKAPVRRSHVFRDLVAVVVLVVCLRPCVLTYVCCAKCLYKRPVHSTWHFSSL